MNNQRSGSEQLILFVLLSLSAMMIYNQFFGHKETAKGPDRPAPSLSQAFARIDPTNPPNAKLLTPDEAKKEKADLISKVDANKEDVYAYWARLRLGLIEQYILTPKDPKPAVKYYDEVIHHAAGDAVEAQALYQKGDLLWNAATKNGTVTSLEQADQTMLKDAVTSLEQLVHIGRGATFINSEIYIPKRPTPTAVTTADAQSNESQAGASQANNAATFTTLPGTNIPAQGFQLIKVSALRSGPNSVLVRVNDYHKSSPFYQAFDTVVKFFGAQPAYSYGLAIIFFATITRLLLQPLNKKAI